MTSGSSYTWDAENHLLTVDTNSATYDALGRTVEIQTGGQIVDVVYAPDGQKLALMSGQTLKNAFVPLTGGGTAVYDSSGLAYYRHPDWLGSSRLASKPDRGVYSETAYAPFGEPYAQSGTTDLSFTGQTQDTNSGLYDFLYRRYSPVQGRWLSPDPAGLAAVDPTNPQSWNRYAYVGNNPAVLIDPLGLYAPPPPPCENGPFGGDCGLGHGVLPCPPGTTDIDFGSGFLFCSRIDGMPEIGTHVKALLLPAPDGGGGNGETLGISNGFVNNVGFGKLWKVWDSLSKWADRAACSVYIYECGKSTDEISKGDNVNKDPMKLLHDAEQCWAQGRTDCSSAGWNNVQRSGIFQNWACGQAYECVLGGIAP